MRRFLTGPTAILTAVLLVAACSSSDDTVDEPTSATPAATVAPPETATTAASTTSTTLSAAAAIATVEALHEAINAWDRDAVLALFANGAFDRGMLPGSPPWDLAFANGEPWGLRSTLSDCEASDGTVTCLDAWERANLSGKAGVVRVAEWSFRFDDQGLITHRKYESVSGYEDDREFEAALGTWMATAHPESYETFFDPTNGRLTEKWNTSEGVAELSPLIDEFVAQSNEYPLDS